MWLWWWSWILGLAVRVVVIGEGEVIEIGERDRSADGEVEVEVGDEQVDPTRSWNRYNNPSFGTADRIVSIRRWLLKIVRRSAERCIMC